MANPTNETSVRVEEGGGRPAWLPWLIGLLLLALLALLLLFVFDDDDAVDVDTPAVSQELDAADVETVEPEDVEPQDVEQGAATAPGDVEIDVADVPAGSALAADVDVFADQVSPGELVGQSVTANGVRVQELVADEAFYVGPEVGNTILVRLQEFAGADAPESPFEVQPGGAVSFTGDLREIDEQFLSELRLYDGADGLEVGDYYVQVDEISSVG